MFTLICARINGWVNTREGGDLRRYRPHYYVIVMMYIASTLCHNRVSAKRSIGNKVNIYTSMIKKLCIFITFIHVVIKRTFMMDLFNIPPYEKRRLYLLSLLSNKNYMDCQVDLQDPEPCQFCRILFNSAPGPLARYVKLWVAHAPGMPGAISPLVNDPDMHYGTCVTHVPWCMSGSLTRGGGRNVSSIPDIALRLLLLDPTDDKPTLV